MICCSSLFHPECLIDWSINKKNCPNCRAEDVQEKMKRARAEVMRPWMISTFAEPNIPNIPNIPAIP